MLTMYLLHLVTLFLAVAAAPPATVLAQKCPDWDLGGIWGKVSGKMNANNICFYENIRFASPPVGKLRFKAPEYPPQKMDPLPAPYPVCFQIDDSKCLAAKPFDEDANCFPSYFGNQTEDCLFLDVYVPPEAFSAQNPIRNLPVVVWIYGGAYMFGSKNQYDLTKFPFYSGNGLIESATKNNGGKKSIIYVTGNYRLGAFGWLAGDYMEKNGDPNAGLLDQRAMLRFVRDHISTIGGDPKQVSVWGESAGASSIMHHLVTPQNIQDPLFNRAVLMSPAYQWLWDRKGDMNDTFTQFLGNVSLKAKCQTADMACLQSAENVILQQVNRQIFQKQACDGVMPLGPSVDGRTIVDLAANSFTKGQAMKLNTIAVSHVNLEVPYSSSTSGSSFIPLPIRKSPQSESAFQSFLDEVFTGAAYKQIRENITIQYGRGKYSDQVARAAAFITDSSFTCNTRFIIDRYVSDKSPVYAMNYALLANKNASTHASDLLPAFYNKKVSYLALLKCIAKATTWFEKLGVDAFWGYFWVLFAPVYQRVLTDHAIWGDPNKNSGSGDKWLPAKLTQCPDMKQGITCVGNLMKPDWNLRGPLSDNSGADAQTAASVCDYWADIAQRVSAIYAKSAAEQHIQVPQPQIPADFAEVVLKSDL